MTSYNYTNDYKFLSYMEYPILLIQEYILVYLVFKYKDMLGKKSLIFAISYILVSILVYFKMMPIFILSFLVVRNCKKKKKRFMTVNQ